MTATEAGRVQPKSTNAPAHDAFTRLLQRIEPDAETLWQKSSTQIDFASGILVLDDSTLEKPYSQFNALVYRHWSAIEQNDFIVLLDGRPEEEYNREHIHRAWSSNG